MFLRSAGASALAAAIRTAAGPLPARPNILIITTDQQSAEAMSCRMGRHYLNTPAMDSLAASGAVFSRAYCANPLCVPSRTSMYTGRYPVETGIETNDPARLDPREFPCLGSIFTNAGYDTAYFGKWHLPFPPDDPRSHGFSLLKPAGGERDPGTAARAAGFLQANRDRPFLMVASFVNPHNICEWARGQELPDGAIGDAPAPEHCPPLRANHAPQRNEPDIVTLMRRSYQSTRMFPVGKFDENKWRQYLWAYYRMIEKVDGLIGRVLGALRESGQERNTLVAFLADHGDCQGAHKWNQKTVLYEEATRVPLIVSWKGVTRPGVSDRLVHTGVDLIPTLAQYAGIRVPPALPGISLMATANGKGSPDPRQCVVVCDKLAQGAPGDPKPDGRMVRGRRYKYCVYSEGQRRESLVDLETDPGEMVNLAGEPGLATVLDQHRSMLAAWCRENGDSFPVIEPHRPARRNPAAALSR